jgi:hypothetical protein
MTVGSVTLESSRAARLGPTWNKTCLSHNSLFVLMGNPKRSFWPGAGIVEEVRYEELQVQWMAGLLFERQVPMNLGHRVMIVEWRRVHVQYLGAPEPDLLEQLMPLDEGFSKLLIVPTTRDAVRAGCHKLVRVLWAYEFWIEGVCSFLIASKKLFVMRVLLGA